jgi:hypothetical protein
MPGFGRITEEDARDCEHLMQMVLAAEPEPPLSVAELISYRTGPILDQGETGTCVGHGWRALLSGAPIQTSRGPKPFDIYDSAIKIDQWPDNDTDTARKMGTSVRAAAKVLQEWGFLERYVWAFSAEDALNWMLAGKGGVVIGINWYDGMMRPGDDGFIHPTGRMLGGHCVYVYGANRKLGFVTIQNSWGTDWGGWKGAVGNKKTSLGKAKISVEDFDRLIKNGGEACTAAEKKNALWVPGTTVTS